MAAEDIYAKDDHTPVWHRTGKRFQTRMDHIPRADPEKPKNLDPVKEWNRVKKAWHGDVERWERYSGLKLPKEAI